MGRPRETPSPVRALWPVYSRDLPPLLRQLAQTPPVRRLAGVGMNCGCTYTAFPCFARWLPYSRLDHSVGVGLIVWHFTGDPAQAAAGLLHDVATPAFAHVVDFLRGDHLRQESTEACTAEQIDASPEIQAVLRRHGLSTGDVSDYHRYPIADNPSPCLSADRLEYTLGNLLCYGFSSLEQLRALYEDLTVGQSAGGTPELAFRTPETARAFAAGALRTGQVYVADEDRFAMQALADLLRLALDRGVVAEKDLWSTEAAVIARLESDGTCGPLWRRFRTCGQLLRSASRPDAGYWVRVPAKLRWIDPLAQGLGRVSQWDDALSRELAAFRRSDFSVWLSARERPATEQD